MESISVAPEVVPEKIDPIRLYVSCASFRGYNASKLKSWLIQNLEVDIIDVNKVATRANAFIEFATPELVSVFSNKSANLKCRGKVVEVRSCFIRANSISINDQTSCTATAQDEKRKEKRSIVPDLIDGRLPTMSELLNRKADRGMSMSSIVDKVTPLKRFSYDDQLKMKHNYVKSLLKNATKNFYQTFNDDSASNQSRSPFQWTVPVWSQPWMAKGFHGCNVSETAVACPQNFREAYRNKCELTISFDEDNKPAIGFVMTQKKSSPVIASLTDEQNKNDIIHITPAMKAVAQVVYDRLMLKNVGTEEKPNVNSVETPVEELKFDVYDRYSKVGCWREVLVRENTATGKVMVAIQTTPPEMWMLKKDDAPIVSEDKKKEMREKLHLMIKAAFPENEELPGAPGMFVESLFAHEHAAVSDFFDETGVLFNLRGPNTLTMTLLGVDFEVAPMAFFQTNVNACEQLFDLSLSLLAPSKKALVLDVCCGSGTIGLCAAARLGESCRVIGVDIVSSAIEDAKKNAIQNGLSDRASYICDKAEVALPSILKSALAMKERGEVDEIVAVVDPPRAGLHPSVLKSLRSCLFIDRIVYISCNPSSLADNLHDLCSPNFLEGDSTCNVETANSCNLMGGAWVPEETHVVDMFPHTLHVETVMLLKRNAFSRVGHVTGDVLQQLKDEFTASQAEREARQAEERKVQMQIKQERQERERKQKEEQRQKRIEAAIASSENCVAQKRDYADEEINKNEEDEEKKRSKLVESMN